jgi:transcriptional regulator with XRE-family HTH domain
MSAGYRRGVRSSTRFRSGLVPDDPFEREAAGQRIARARRRRGLPQAVLAGLVGRSESWLSQVERGKRGVDSYSVLVRLAEVLRVDIEELTGSADRDETGRRAYPAASLIEQAMLGYGVSGPLDDGEGSGREVSLDFLRTQARSAYQAYQGTRYDAAGRVLPGLIREVETAARTADPASPAACAVRARVYDTTAALLSRVGEPFLAWAAADRAMFAAEQSGDPLLAAASAWRLSYMVTGRKHPQEALKVAMAAAAALERRTRVPSPERLSVYGALHLAAATAAAASFDRETTGSLLATARGIADRTGEANHIGTAFGPVNVAIHAISASLKLGDPRTAAETGEALNFAAMPAGLVGRRTQVNLDLARAYAMTRKDAAAVNLLLAAERLSPQLVRYDPATRDVLIELLRREHRPSTPELRPLARRAGVI